MATPGVDLYPGNGQRCPEVFPGLTSTPPAGCWYAFLIESRSWGIYERRSSMDPQNNPIPDREDPRMDKVRRDKVPRSKV